MQSGFAAFNSLRPTLDQVSRRTQKVWAAFADLKVIFKVRAAVCMARLASIGVGSDRDLDYCWILGSSQMVGSVACDMMGCVNARLLLVSQEGHKCAVNA